ncbi:spermine synthase-like isoform X2 [Dysidea avara]|uniref:spermine synthase-like isoform X2 n=1 Tax=Dysidea avara TaxID=196820 RepID=UPI0033251528
MALTHTILQFNLEERASAAAYSALNEIEQILLRHGLQGRVTETFRANAKPLLMFLSDGGRFTAEAYDNGLVCVDIVQPKENPLIKDLTAVETAISEAIVATISQWKFSIQKGAAPHVGYFMISDDEVQQFQFTKRLYSARSQYQQIDIFHSNEFGAMLFLDFVVNLAESDEIYTKTLLGNGKYNMTNSKILILGGGDGAALKEILTYNPAMVTMIELDQMVMDAVRQHMRSVCDDVMDQLKGDNYEIIVSDCVPVMKEMAEKGELFDYIIYDITDVPVSPTPTDGLWKTIHDMLDNAMRLLSPTGYCMVQGHRSCCPKTSRLYEEQLNKLHCPVVYTKDTVFVPSFREEWLFYRLQKK